MDPVGKSNSCRRGRNKRKPNRNRRFRQGKGDLNPDCVSDSVRNENKIPQNGTLKVPLEKQVVRDSGLKVGNRKKGGLSGAVATGTPSSCPVTSLRNWLAGSTTTDTLHKKQLQVDLLFVV